MFYHAYYHYLDHAFPDDELKPLSCTGRRRDGKNVRGTMDDCLGDYSLTLVDSMDTLVVLGDYEEFERAVGLVLEHVTFDRDVSVNVFEVTIRMLGGLLSSHVLAVELQQESHDGNQGYLFDYQMKLYQQFLALDGMILTKYQERIVNNVDGNRSYMQDYSDELLSLAVDLGNRILPAFDSSTGLPYSLINLKKGVTTKKTKTCLAGAGTLSLEFITLSTLTGDPIYQVGYIPVVDVFINIIITI